MTTEQQFILQLLSDHIHRLNTVCPNDLDWNIILRYANSHQIEGIIFKQCGNRIPDGNALKRLTELYATDMFYHANRVNLETEIRGAFRHNNIDFFFVKGSEVASLYPIPALRTMGDSDIVLHSYDKEKAHRLLQSMGYRNVTKLDHEWSYFKNKMEFEIHDHLLYERSNGDESLEQYFNACWNYVQREDILDWNFHFLFLIVHLRKHILCSGAGLRQFMDIAVLMKNNEKLNWSWIEQELSKLGLLKFAQTVVCLCEKWFGVPAKIISPVLEETFYEETTAKIFDDGVFGFDNEENNTNNVVNDIRKTKRAKSTMIKRALGYFFPPYKEMRKSEHYAFLRGRPYLLPLVWIYRFFYGIARHKQKKVIRHLKGSFITEKTLENRKVTLERWGL